jgi:hypothetical protein
MMSSISAMTRSGSAADLVEYRQHLEALVDGRHAVGHALCLDALRGVNHEKRALAGRKRPRDLVGKIHVAGRVDEVQLVGPAVRRGVVERHTLGLDRNAALPLEIHRVEHLRAHLAFRQPATKLDKPVRQRRLAVVDMGNN